MAKRDAKDWSPATKLVRGGTMRSQFGETSEAIFLTSGYAYDSAEQAARRMSGEEEGFVYSRYANPTVRMLEDRLSLLEGAETCRVTASGMGCHVNWYAMRGLSRRYRAMRFTARSVAWVGSDIERAHSLTAKPKSARSWAM